MVGGQVLIIFVGGAAFKITPLNGKEWGLSIGLGAISLPWGAFIRKFPDHWASKLVPPMPNFWPFSLFKKAKIEAEQDEDEEDEEKAQPEGETSAEDEAPFEPMKPLRTLTSLRGKRAQTHIRRSFRHYMHDQKVKVKEMAHAGAGGGKAAA